MATTYPAWTKLLTIDEVAERLQVTTRTVYEYCNRGELEFVKLGRNVLRFKPEWIDDFIARKQHGA
jgi:excisionase family DNA binding protein